MIKKRTIFWFRQDLRLSDNPGLFAAAESGSVMPVYIFDEGQKETFGLGSASKWWLHHSLRDLNNQLNNNLNVYAGRSQDILLKLIKENKVDAVYWNRCYEPSRIREDTDIKATLKSQNIECHSFNASLLWEPWKIVKKDGTWYKVYTPYFRNGCLQAPQPRIPIPKPKQLTLIEDPNNKNTIATLNLLGPRAWHEKLQNYWDIGEKAAQRRLTAFLDHGFEGYKEGRNFPAKSNISKLSPHLHFGEISPNQVWHSAQAHGLGNSWFTDTDCFLSELGWREFSYYLLYHFPELPRKNFQSKFDAFPWQDNHFLLESWQKGQTGYPIVDAGMRELWQTGFMHNRVRMIVASFLVKNLRIHWRHGEDWFWDCLLDADLASNSASWQWVAGSGADAAPYFRIFNPITQGEKFDPDGVYTRRFVPELAKLPNQFLFKPWEAPDQVLRSAGVILGANYPKPIVNLQHSRDEALGAYRTISGRSPDL